MSGLTSPGMARRSTGLPMGRSLSAPATAGVGHHVGARPAPGAQRARRSATVPAAIQSAQTADPATHVAASRPMTASASRTAPHSTVDRLPANAVIPGSSLHLRQVIAPASTFQPSTAPLIRRAPAAPPVGTPRGRGAPPVPVTGAAGALPGTLSPANLAAFGTAVTGTSQLARRFAAASGHPPTAAGQPSGNHNATIHRMFELPSPSELFERARSWFTGEPDVNPADPNGPGDSSGRNSVSGPSDPDNDGARFIDPSNPIPGIPPTDLDPPTHSTELAERPRSLRALLRQGGSMTEPTANHQDQQVADALSPREWDQLVDLVVERIEERVRDELSRRGRRFSPGVF